MPKNEKLDTKRHSLAHLMAASILELFPEAKFGVGPVVEDGFYYDVHLGRSLTPEDLQVIEKRMREKVKQNLRFERSEMPVDSASEMFRKMAQDFKVELLHDLKTRGTTAVADLDDPNLVGSNVSEVSVYKTGPFIDLCRGPHVAATSEIDPESFRLTRISGAYWRGNQAREQMQRVYGVAFNTKQELEDYFVRLEEARKRDHRKLGRELGLFTFHQWAPGAAFWLPKGTTLYNTLANYMREVLFPAGYVEVRTPLIYNKALWERSGHWKHYRKNMFLIESENETMSLKPMNCPGHFLTYACELHSYRDLPIRFHEQTPLHRNEASGVLSGLTRVRQFSQDDAHCFLTQDQIGEEVERLIRLVQRVYGDFGLRFSAKLSTRPDEFLGQIATWDHAESQLKAALESARMAYSINEKDGAFYGPKIDFDVTDAIGRNWQCATIELDSSVERMNAKIRNAQMQKVPYMLVVGDREQEQGAVAVRLRSGEDLKSKLIDE